jgi:hypothetical protein
LTQPLCSSRITGLLRSYWLVRPSASLRASRLMVFLHLCFSLDIETLVPVVPHESPDQVHAPYTPAVTRPVTKFLANFCPRRKARSWFRRRVRSYRRVIEGFTFVRLPDPYLLRVTPVALLQRSLPRLLTAAAWRGLEPALGSRLRRAYLHLSCNFCTSISSRFNLP